MKILQIGKYFPPYTGGIENNTYHCCKTLARDHEVTALVFNQGRKTRNENYENFQVIRVGVMGTLFSQALSLDLFTYMRKLKPDLIHLHAPNPLAVASILLASPGVPLTITHHTDIVRQHMLRPFVLPMYHLLLKRALSVILYTKIYGDTSRELRRYQDKFVIIPHGTDQRPFAASEGRARMVRDFRRMCGGAPTVSFIGRQVQYKGVDNLLRALHLLPGVHALIGGRGPHLHHSVQLCQDLGLTERVHFIEQVDHRNKAALLEASDIYVLPCTNRTESFGQSLVEAQLCRLPTITCDVRSGVCEVTQHQKTGLMVPPDHISALKNAILQLVNNPAQRAQMGEAGYARATERYTEEVTGPLLTAHFAHLQELISQDQRVYQLAGKSDDIPAYAGFREES
jgi:rhamnosyl/mannosyltransferase